MLKKLARTGNSVALVLDEEILEDFAEWRALPAAARDASPPAQVS